MSKHTTQQAAESATQITVKSRETGKLYIVVREYRHSLLVRPAWKNSGLPFTLPKSAFIFPTPNNPEQHHDSNMISPHTQAAITALLAVDPTATDSEREAVAAAMQGIDSQAVLSVKEVAKRLGRTRQTVYNLVKRGVLIPIKTGSICTGVTAQSLARYLQGAA